MSDHHRQRRFDPSNSSIEELSAGAEGLTMHILDWQLPETAERSRASVTRDTSVTGCDSLSPVTLCHGLGAANEQARFWVRFTANSPENGGIEQTRNWVCFPSAMRPHAVGMTGRNAFASFKNRAAAAATGY